MTEAIPDPFDPSNVIVGGLALVNVHSSKLCAGRGCSVHHPSDHPMRSFPMLWKDDGKFFERWCPHSVAHPDPDDAAYYANSLGVNIYVHDCCSHECCGYWSPLLKEVTDD